MLNPAGSEQQRNAIIDAACAWGWDRASSANGETAETLLAAAPELAQTDFLLACIAGECDHVVRMLEHEPGLARRSLPPRGWEPLLYVAYCVLLRQPSGRTGRIIATAKHLLERGADPNCHYGNLAVKPDLFPALYAAIAISTNLALARLLLDAGADPNDGQSLYHAAERFDQDALELLFGYGLSGDSLSYCLFHKLDFGYEPGIRWFLDHGADPNTRHPRANESTLHWAIKRACDDGVVELLLSRGADPNARTRAGHTDWPKIFAWTPLDLAERLGRVNAAALLRRHGAQSTPPSGADLFLHACAGADRPTAQQYMQSQPDIVRELRIEDQTLIAHVAQQNEKAAVALMLELGFDPNVRGWMNRTPLDWAACYGDPALVRLLLAHGARHTDDPDDSKGPIHTALYSRWNPAGDYVGVLTELVAAGAKLPADLKPTGSAELDAAAARFRSGL
jgi:ankyrin repeat protein